MIFIFKKPVLNVDCYTYTQHIIDLFPIQQSSKFFPGWWKELPKTYTNGSDEYSTMKYCEGFTSHYKNGFIMPLWTDLDIDVYNNRYTWKSANYVKISEHDHMQRGKFLDKMEYGHLKISSPWLIKCKQNTPFLFQPTFWNFDNPDQLLIPPGTLDFKYQHATHINAFVHYSLQQTRIRLSAGQPMIQMIPLTDKKIKLHLHCISEQEFEKNQIHKCHFIRNYRKIKQLMMKKEKQTSCPFGFGKKD
jgi:hypothetical protein